MKLLLSRDKIVIEMHFDESCYHESYNDPRTMLEIHEFETPNTVIKFSEHTQWYWLLQHIPLVEIHKYLLRIKD